MKNQKTRGLFIVFEGLDRCGKTTQSERVVQYLQSLNKTAQIKKFPDRTTMIGQQINNFLKGGQTYTDQTIHLLFSADRWENKKDIEEKISSGINIISDRYAYSGVCYSTAKGLKVEWCKNCDKGLPQPDVIFYLYASEEVTSKRGGFGEEIYENNQFQKKVRAEFESLLRNEKNVVRIDTEQSLDDVTQEIKGHIDVLMQRRLKNELDELWMD